MLHDQTKDGGIVYKQKLITVKLEIGKKEVKNRTDWEKFIKVAKVRTEVWCNRRRIRIRRRGRRVRGRGRRGRRRRKRRVVYFLCDSKC
jgi:hypothetical protein